MAKRSTLARPAILPADHEPMAEWITRRERAFVRRDKRREAERWLAVDIPEHQGLPFAVAALGDIHGDDPDCNFPLLRRDLAAIAATPGCYGLHIGDASNNWVGRLMSKFAEQGATQSEARAFIEYLMHGCGVDWLCWLGGNHDKWNEGLAILGLLAGPAFYLPFWEARLELRCGRRSWKVHAAHDFRGHSDWNPTHGPLKAAYRGSVADLYVCGHRHEWGTQSFEIADQGRVVHVARARGYKWSDDYAIEKGFQSSRNGAGVVAIFDPRADAANSVLIVPDVKRGCELLALMRADAAKRGAPKRRIARKGKGR